MRNMQASESNDKLDELSSSLDDLTTTVEELQIDPPADVDPGPLERVKDALEEAIAATDELEDPPEEPNAPTPKA